MTARAPFTPTLNGRGTQVVEYPNREPEQQIVYDADSAADFRHFTVEDAASGLPQDASDRAVEVAREHMQLGISDLDAGDDSEGGHAD